MTSQNLKVGFYLINICILVGFVLTIIVSGVAIHNMIPDHNEQICTVVSYNSKDSYFIKPVDSWECDVERSLVIEMISECFEGSYRLYYGDVDRNYYNIIPIYYNRNKTIVRQWLETHFPLGSSIGCSYAAKCLSLHFEEPYWMLLTSYIIFLILLTSFTIINYCFICQCKHIFFPLRISYPCTN